MEGETTQTHGDNQPQAAPELETPTQVSAGWTGCGGRHGSCDGAEMIRLGCWNGSDQ